MQTSVCRFPLVFIKAAVPTNSSWLSTKLTKRMSSFEYEWMGVEINSAQLREKWRERFYHFSKKEKQGEHHEQEISWDFKVMYQSLWLNFSSNLNKGSHTTLSVDERLNDFCKFSDRYYDFDSRFSSNLASLQCSLRTFISKMCEGAGPFSRVCKMVQQSLTSCLLPCLNI